MILMVFITLAINFAFPGRSKDQDEDRGIITTIINGVRVGGSQASSRFLGSLMPYRICALKYCSECTRAAMKYLNCLMLICQVQHCTLVALH